MKSTPLFVGILLFLVPACSSNQVEGAAGGAAGGAIYGAAGSALMAAVFGGDVGESAARGAVAGGTVGAISGAVSAGEQDARAQEQQQRAELEQQNQELARRNRELELERQLIAEVGPDNTEGLASLIRCRHDEALAHARRGEQGGTDDFRRAAVWLQAMVAVDQRTMEDARALYSRLVEVDPRVTTIADAERETLDLVSKLEDTRAEFGLPRRCR